MTNQEYKQRALGALKGNWTAAVVATLLIALVEIPYIGLSEIPNFMKVSQTMVASLGGVGGLYLIFIGFPLIIGYAGAMRLLVTAGDGRVPGNMWRIATTDWLHYVWGYFLLELRIFLWTLLLIIPGIIKSFAYAMTPLIMTEHPEMSASDAISLSNEMMRGHKFDLFYLYLSFIGWILLSIISCGIGFIWLTPYMYAAEVAFYEDVKAQYEGVIPVSE